MKGGAGGGDVHAAAARGTAGSGSALPFFNQIQKSFGSHDISNVQAYSGGAARQATSEIGAEAFATGTKVAFGQAPSLHTAAHEAAHIVQQRAGVQLSGGVGSSGDRYERHADAVADRVVAGQSAEALLSEMTGGATGGSAVQRSVQCYKQYPAGGTQDAAKKDHWKSPGAALRVTEDGSAAVEQPSMFGSDRLYILPSRLSTINATLGAENVPLKFATAGGTVKGAPPSDLSKGMQTLSQVKPVQVADPTKAASIPDDCGKAAHTVTGAKAEGKRLKAEYSDPAGGQQNVNATHPEIMKLEIMASHFGAQIADAPKLVAEAQTELNKELYYGNRITRKQHEKLKTLGDKVQAAVDAFKAANAAGDTAGMNAARTKYQTAKAALDAFLAQKEATTGLTLLELFQRHATAYQEKMKRIDAIMKPYNALDANKKEAFDQKAGINRYANPDVGEAYTISSGGAPLSSKTWNYHWGGVIFKSTTGSDNVNMEGFAGSIGKIYYQIYGIPTASDKRKGQTFHEQARDDHRQHGDAPTTMSTEKK